MRKLISVAWAWSCYRSVEEPVGQELTASPLCAALCQIAADAVSPSILDLKGNALMLFFLQDVFQALQNKGFIQDFVETLVDELFACSCQIPFDFNKSFQYWRNKEITSNPSHLYSREKCMWKAPVLSLCVVTHTLISCGQLWAANLLCICI